MPTEPNYSESSVSGTSWKRAVRVLVENPLGGAPALTIIEEEAISLNGKNITRPVANLNVQFDQNNPLHLQAYSVLNAIYIEEREKRDAAVQP